MAWSKTPPPWAWPLVALFTLTVAWLVVGHVGETHVSFWLVAGLWLLAAGFGGLNRWWRGDGEAGR